MSLESNRVSISDIEQQAMSMLNTALREHIDLASGVIDLIATLLDRDRVANGRPPAQSRDVTVHLLERLSRDIRCIELLAERGYALQAASLAACAFEVGYAIAYIGCDDALGEKWLSHCDITRPYRDTKALLRGALSNLGIGDTAVREARVGSLYDAVYRPVAGAKHGNPNLQRLLSSEDDVSINSANAPMVTEQTIRMAELAVLAATNAGVAAIRVFVPSHLPAEQQRELITAVEHLEAEYARLVSRHNSEAQHRP